MSLAPVPSHPRRLVYLGTPALAAEPLRALVAAGFDVPLVITRVDKRRGRGSELQPSPVKAAAIELGIPVSHSVDDALAVGADLGVVVAFGQLIRPHVLAQLPMVNLHFSLLPRWRGAAPMERALLAGDTETGVGLMQLEEGLDTGPLFTEARVEICADDTGESLRETLTAMGSFLLVRSLQQGLSDPRPQVGQPLYAAKLSINDLRIDWTQPAIVIDRQIRLGGAWTTADGRRLKVIAATVASGEAGVSGAPGQMTGSVVRTGDGALQLETVRPEGKGAMPVKDWLNGAGRSLKDGVLGR
jgi:methionyl-tRNA formyltransferase